MRINTVIFDAYGTLFDVNAAARQVAESGRFDGFSDLWPNLSAAWRDKQLQYTWLRAVTGDHVDFWKVTGEGLDWAMESLGLSDVELRDQLMQLYWELSAYSEVADLLSDLKDRECATGILSNGSPEMLQAAVRSAGIARLLDHVLSVESVGIFKPARQVYDMVGRAFGCEAGNVLFVSSNGWDAAAAKGYGFETVWVNRAGQPMDRLPWRPDHILEDLRGVPALLT